MVRKQRRYKRVPLKIMSELNMTPVIDITFLMLIAFLVTYPLMENSVKIRLPHASTNPPAQNENPKPHNLAINAAGEIFLDDAAITLEALEASLAQRVLDEPQAAVIIRGDEAMNYGQLMKVVAILNKVKVRQMALMTFAETAK